MSGPAYKWILIARSSNECVRRWRVNGDIVLKRARAVRNNHRELSMTCELAI